MKKLYAIAAAASALALATTTPVQAQSRQDKGEERLAELIEGRVAGEPKSCITAFRSNDIRVIPYVGVVYERGDTVWVARAVHPRSLRDDDVPVFERFGSSLCATDVIRTVDRYQPHFTTGSVFLEDFVPYTEVRGG